MNKKICFIGHRQIFDSSVESRLIKEVQNQIDLGNTCFMVGTHGYFDKLALSVCRRLRDKYKQITITVVLTSLAKINYKICGELMNVYDDVDTVMYNIEEEFFKRRITASNKYMINDCDILICYVNPDYVNSGAKLISNYAKKQGLEVINLYKQLKIE